MKSIIIKSIMLILLLLVIQCRPLLAQSDPVPFSRIFHGLGTHFIESFTYNYGLNHVSGIAASWAMIESGVDWDIRKFSSENNAITYSGFPSVIIGGLVPLILPAGLFFYGGSKKDYQLQNTALALGQAAILGWAVSSLYKAVTGRKPPNDFEKEDNQPDYSDDFRFGFYQRGIFEGWPSGHATTAFAMATTLVELYPDNNIITYSAFSYATFIAAGIAVNIHWASDAVAGALMGYAIGKAVGNGFNPQPEKLSGLVITPTLSGVSLIWKF